jgi:PAS domain S-box-containing protein
MLRVHSTSALLRTDEGAPSGIVSVAVDLSERVATERRLQTAEDFLRTVTNSMTEGLFTLDPEGRLTFINDAAECMLGWRAAQLEGRPMHECVHYEHPDGSPHRPEDCPIEQARASGEAVRIDDDVFVRRDGTHLPVAYASTPFTTGDGAKGWVVVFTDITERKAHAERMRRQLESLSWSGRLRHALAHHQFVLAAQPIIDLSTGETVQHELLLRLREDDGTIIPPGQFLPAAEESGLIRDIDRWVVRQAAALAAQGHPVEFNVSGTSLGETDFHVLAERAIEDAGADPALMVFELTETALLRNEVSAKAFIERLSALGCRFALDDFGTGYAGFTHLKRLPVNYLKIDKEFVRELPRDEGNRHVVQAVVNLARGFGQQTVAEGVETRRTLALLREIGVDFAQGYVIGRPRPVERVFRLHPEG